MLLACELLEERIVLSVTASLVGSDLTITINSSSTGYVRLENGNIEVADNPGYSSKTTFSAPDVQTVTVVGDDAQDALAVTAGTIAASLSTTGTSSVTFSNAAAFSDGVTVGLGMGALTVGGLDSITSSIEVTSTAGALNVDGPLTAGQNVALTSLSGAVSIAAGGNISAQDIVTINGSTGIQIAANVTTAGGAVSFDSPVTMTGPVTIDTAGAGNSGNILFSSTLDGTAGGNANLTLEAGSAGVSFRKAVGSSSPLGSIAITSARSVTASGTIQLDGSTTGAASNGLSIGANVDGVDFAAPGSVIENFAGNGIVLEGGTAGSTIAGFTLETNANDGVLLAGGQYNGSSIVDNVIEGNINNGVEADGALEELLISGNTIENNVHDGFQLAGDDVSGTTIVASNAGTTIANNTIGGSTGNGLELLGPATSLAIAGNTFGTSSASGATSTPNAIGIVLAPGDYSGTTITGNTIAGNTYDGIITPGAVTSLTIANNTIANNGGDTPDQAKDAEASGNPSAVVAGGTGDGVQLAGGNDTGTTVSGNTIEGNAGYGIHLTAGVVGLAISNNTIGARGAPNADGIGVAAGNDTGTAITGNTIQDNTIDGIVMGIGVPPSANAGNPLTGYGNDNQHYIVPYVYGAGEQGYGTNDPADPGISLMIGSAGPLTIPMDTGSRGLFVSINELPKGFAVSGTPGQIYLNSSDRVYYGTWCEETVTFANARYYVNGKLTTGPPAQSHMLVLVVTAVGASTTPAPGALTASTTFGTSVKTGTVTITNGQTTQTVPITDSSVTIPGGYWATYQANPVLNSVENFGVAFNRSGEGTLPDNNAFNQQYDGFLNLTQMQAGTMVAGYIVTPNGVQLGLDDSVSGYAYTNLTPTGLGQVPGSPPDWQAPTGNVSYNGTAYGTSQLVIDSGITHAILTLPGYSANSTFSGTLGVNLLNSNGLVGYDINLSTDSLLNPVPSSTSVAVPSANPLPGTHTENLPPTNEAFFNTGSHALNGFNYLYDASDGYIGVLPNGLTPADDYTFTPGFYANPLPQPATPGPVTNLTIGGTGAQGNTIQNNGAAGIELEAFAFTGTVIAGNTIRNNVQDGVLILGSGASVGGLSGNTVTGNGGNGIEVSGPDAVGDAILGNSLFLNSGLGIALTSGGNASQPAPVLSSVKCQSVAAGPAGPFPYVIQGNVPATPGYTGLYIVQFFANPGTDGVGSGFEGRTLIGTIEVPAGPFATTVSNPSVAPGAWVTATATPATSPANTSAFSAAVSVRATVLEVTTTANSGPGSLRNAINIANGSTGPVFIDFDLPGPNTTLTLLSPLPALARPVEIDGGSQPGYLGTPVVTIRGTRGSRSANGFIIGPGAAGSTIVDLAINDFTRGDGIRVAAGNVTLEGNSLTNDSVGIALASAAGAAVNGNTMTNSATAGILAKGKLAGGEVQDNIVTESRHYGVVLQRASGLSLGGTTPSAGNTITLGTRWRGWGLPQTGLVALGVSSGTNVQGNTIAGNNGNGVRVNNTVGITIGGASPSTGNQILRNRGFGLRAVGAFSGAVIAGNTIAGNGINVKVSHP
ncbi:MAG: right-handed parallel beta-helix repeat-containing protein [Isosphaeraceae bacterium]|nr:right-handed parallel beta-helix repeat-containing protein [Isosphaeraceae bacterium]